MGKGGYSGIRLQMPNNFDFHTRNKNQTLAIEKIFDNTLTFLVGPAGTGKTFLAVAAAMNLFTEKKINKIVLTRPAVEAGEKIGFLPGDMDEKVAPYLHPLIDSVDKVLGQAKRKEMQARGILEVVPLAYIRGRTFEKSVVIIDEAQNTTPVQMKMLLTRIGNDSKMVVTGDESQSDLPYNVTSGLTDVLPRLADKEDIGMLEFDVNDVVRHKLVKTIIEAYDEPINR
jgi:phosphate starvation-inducible PhoH-like protein